MAKIEVEVFSEPEDEFAPQESQLGEFVLPDEEESFVPYDGDETEQLTDGPESEEMESEKILTCKLCNEVSTSLEILELHMVNFHRYPVDSFPSLKNGLTVRCCVKCQLYFTSLEEFRKHHFYSHPLLAKHCCPICPSFFSAGVKLRKHRTAEHPKCTRCQMRYFDELAFKQHIPQCGTNEKLNSSKLKVKEESYEQHISVTHHQKVMEHFCSNCSKSFTFKKDLITHTKVEHPKCKYCFKVLTRDEFPYHISRYHKKFAHKVLTVVELIKVGLIPKIKQPLQCDKCPFTAMKHTVFMKHKKKHRIVCDKCKFSTLCEVKLKDHQNDFHHANGHKCESCSFISPAINMLKEHIRKEHSTYKCKKCTFSCSKNRMLISHMIAQHRTLKKIKCGRQKCDFICYTKGDLFRHNVNMHLYRCLKCPYVTPHRKQFRRHHHRNDTKFNKTSTMYYCEHCDYYTQRSKTALVSHLIRCHLKN